MPAWATLRPTEGLGIARNEGVINALRSEEGGKDRADTIYS